MPNPLHKVNRKASANIAIGAITERPDLALHVADVISTWAHCDSMLVAMLARFLKVDAAWVVNQMLEALTSSDARRAAIAGAAKAALKPKEYAVYEKVMKQIAPSRNTRHVFAHWLWGVSPEIPDALLLMDPADFTRAQLTIAETIRRIRNFKKDAPKEPRPDEGYENKNAIMVWKRKELEKAAKDAHDAYEAISRLYRYLDDGTPMHAPWRNELLHAILTLQALQDPYPQNTQQAQQQ
ncbi:MAG: hypothetical protein ACT4UQ_04300 [Gammaproteobacteria bacterium]